MKLKKGDTVEVITGKDKGKRGEIAFVFPKIDKIIVNGVNMASKHQKARRANEPGGIIEKDLPFDASNVMLRPQGQDGSSRLPHRRRRQEGAHRVDRAAR